MIGKIVRKLISNNKNEIVLIALTCLKPRIMKIGFALKSKGFKVLLLVNSNERGKLTDLCRTCFSGVHFFSSDNLLMFWCYLYNPLVYHIFSEANVPMSATILIKNKHILGKIVFDEYDTWRGYWHDEIDEIAEREKFCLENADGLCCRMFETQYLKRNYNYKCSGKRILFFDYCWGINTSKCVRDHESTEVLKVVYGGRLLPRPIENPERYYTELAGFQYITNTIEAINGKFLIIPYQICKGKEYSAYTYLSKRHDCLSILNPLPFDELIKMESNMDYGIDNVELEEYIDKYDRYFGSYNFKIKNRYYATNKYFDYLDANVMPIYGRKNEIFGWYLEKKGGAVRCVLEDMPRELPTLINNKKINKIKAAEAKQKLSITKHINRLIDFYRIL